MQEWPTREGKKTLCVGPLGCPPTHPDKRVFSVCDPTQMDYFGHRNGSAR
jgi:hypothetical protein